MAKLTGVFIKSAPPGKYGDGHGLRLVKRANGGGQWVFLIYDSRPQARNGTWWIERDFPEGCLRVSTGVSAD